jgi:UPF0755 protein
MRRIKRLLFLFFFLLLSMAGGAAYYATRPLPLPTQPFAFSLNQGASLKSAARQFQQSGLIPSDQAFVLLARVLGKSGQIKAGNYELESSVSMLGLLDMLVKGQVSQGEIGIIEGWTFREFRAAMQADPGLRHDSASLSEEEIMQRIGASEKQAEGLFFPDTYYYAKGSSDLVIYRRAYQTMQRHLQEAWQGRDTDLPLESPYQALTLASIVEKETGKAQDRDMIAGVFTNRLRKGMRLQTDPSVIYGIGEKFDGNLRKRDLLKDTPYNTYTRAGLTPTPIALPGLASLHAALHPAKTDALYFVARGDGSSEFSSTLEKHNRAVNHYQLHQK